MYLPSTILRPLFLIIVFGLLPLPQAMAVLRHPDMTDAESLNLAALPQFASRARVGGCSASMLNSEWAVSAAHCINLQDEARVTLYYTSASGTQSMGATAYRVLSGDGGYDDVMLIKLDTPIASAEAWVAPYDRFDEYEQLGWQLGQGTSGALGQGTAPGGAFRAMTQRIFSTTREANNGAGASIIPQHIFYNYNGSPEAAAPSPATTRFEGGTGPGDSGGPLYVYSRGRYFNASVVSGPSGDGNNDYRNSRLSTHLDAIVARAGFEFAYPQALQPLATWVAEDLTAAFSNTSTVTTWTDRLSELSWSNTTDGGSGAPQMIHTATPTGLAAVRFDGDDALGLSIPENLLAGQTSFSIALVVRSDSVGAGSEVDPFGATAVLDASITENGWGISYAQNGRYGLSIEDQDGSVKGIFRGGAGNGSLGDGEWHVVVATWDGSELLNDHAGDDRNMKVYVDSVEQARRGQGAYHFNVARGAGGLLLGGSQSNGLNGFSGDIAEVRIYAGELAMHEVDRLLDGLRARYVSGTPGVVFERPWSSQISIEAGHRLTTRGLLSGGGRSMIWTVASGPGAVVFSDADSPSTEMEFEAVGSYVLRAVVSNGLDFGYTDLTVDVLLPGADAPSIAPTPVAGAWLRSDIGGVGLAGSSSETAGVWTLSGAGTGVGVGTGETYDEGHFLWKAVAGDFDWVARLDSLGNVSGSTRAGLMLRGGPGPTDAAAFVGFAPDNTAYALFRRDGGWYADLRTDASTGVSLPGWLKLERRGTIVTAYTSVDGISYTPITEGRTIRLPGVVRVGLFVTSGNPGATVPAVFSHLDLGVVNRSPASKVELDRPLRTGAQFEAYTVLSGSDEPWLSVRSAVGAPALNFVATYRNERHVLVASGGSADDYQVRLAVDDGNTISTIERRESLRFQTRYDFETDGETEGWSGNNIDGLTSADGRLSGSASTNDPQLIVGGLALSGDGYRQVAVRIRSSVGATLQLFWSHSTAGGFAGARSVTAAYSTPGVEQTVVFDLSAEPEWNGKTITGLRLDPLNGAVSGLGFEIDSIEVSDGLPRPVVFPVYTFEQGAYFENWVATKEITGLRVLGGALKGSAAGVDPVLVNDVDDFPADAATGLLIRMMASVNAPVEFFWSTAASPGFAAARRVSVPYTGAATLATASKLKIHIRLNT